MSLPAGRPGLWRVPAGRPLPRFLTPGEFSNLENCPKCQAYDSFGYDGAEHEWTCLLCGWVLYNVERRGEC